MGLLEEILRDKSNYAKDHIKIREVKNNLNQYAASMGQQSRLEDKRQ